MVFESIYEKYIQFINLHDLDSIFVEEVYGTLGELIEKTPSLFVLITKKFNGNGTFTQLL